MHLAGDVVAHIDLLIVEQHAIDGLDGDVGSFRGLVVDETIALGATLLVSGNLTREHVAESGKRVMKSLKAKRLSNYLKGYGQPSTHLVINLLVKVFDENVTLTGLAKGGVSLRPHDSATCRSVKKK